MTVADRRTSPLHVWPPTHAGPHPVAHSLAHPSIDPPTLVARVRDALGWHGSDFVVGLCDYTELMATVETAHDVDGLFRIGDPGSPHVRLLRALDDSRSGLRVTRVARLAAPWRWSRVGAGSPEGTGPEITGVVLRQQTYADTVALLGRAGVTFRVVPDETRTAELVELARPLGSAVLDVDELDLVPGGGATVTGWLDDAPDVVYGLVSREESPAVDTVWLSMTPDEDAAGTLVRALERFSNRGFDLEFLHSDPRPGGVHGFYLGFGLGEGDVSGSGSWDAGASAAAGLERVTELQGRLLEVGFGSRVLAAFARATR